MNSSTAKLSRRSGAALKALESEKGVKAKEELNLGIFCLTIDRKLLNWLTYLSHCES